MIRPAALLAALVLAAAPAAGQDALADMLEVFNGQGDSLTNIFLGRIFGCKLFPGIPDCENLPRPAFAAVIGLFNAFCMALGMALFSWNATVGTMQTAHEGQIFGNNWSSLWAPIRTIAAVAMFTPLPAVDYYNTVQLSVSWLVRGSTASASIVWSRASTMIINHQAPVTTPEMIFDQEVLRAGWQLAACQAVIEDVVNAYVRDGGNAGRITLVSGYRERRPQEQISPDDHLLVGTGDGPAAVAREFGTRKTGDGGDYPFEICGTIGLPAPPAVVLSAGQGERWYRTHRGAMQAVLNTLRPVAARLLEQASARPGEEGGREVSNAAAAILAAGERYHGELSRELPGIARDSAIPLGNGGTVSGAARERIDLIVAGAYSETCASRTERVADDPLQWICREGGAGQGWLGTGAWYMHMARFANEANALFNFRPEAREAPEFQEIIGFARADARRLAGEPFLLRLFGDPADSRVFDEAARAESLLERQWNAAVIQAAQAGTRIDGRLIEGAFETEGINPHMQGWRDAPRDWMTRKARDWFLPPATVDPMASLAEFGNAQLAWGLGLTGAGKVLQSGYLSFLPAPNLVEELGKVATIVGVALLTSGAFLAFVLPMLPFLLWTAAVTGYFILVAEAIIAVNLWAVAHLRMDGHSFAGEAARQGYYLILALTLSPILMVFGFILSMGIFKVTATLVGIGFDVAVQGIAHDQSWIVWLVGMAVIGILMVIVYVVLAERSFSLTAELPTRILRWLGASAEISSKEDDRIRAGALAAAGALTAAGREIIQGSGGRSRRRADARPPSGEGG